MMPIKHIVNSHTNHSNAFIMNNNKDNDIELSKKFGTSINNIMSTIETSLDHKNDNIAEKELTKLTISSLLDQIESSDNDNIYKELEKTFQAKKEKSRQEIENLNEFEIAEDGHNLDFDSSKYDIYESLKSKQLNTALVLNQFYQTIKKNKHQSFSSMIFTNN